MTAAVTPRPPSNQPNDLPLSPGLTDADGFHTGGPERKQGGEAPKGIQAHQHGEGQGEQVEEAAQSGSYQRHRQQQADADPVCR